MNSKRIFLSKGSLAYKEWGAPTFAKKVLAIHGWLDNSNSFNFLGPYLAERGFHVVAYDNIGHGYSTHEKASSNNYSVAPYVGRCRDVIEALQWERCSIVGHSLGAALAVLFAGSHPDMVDKIALIDGFATPLTQPAERAASNLRRAIDMEIEYKAKQLRRAGLKQYATLEDAIAARMNSVKTYPGRQFLSVQAACALVSRGVSVVGSPEEEAAVDRDLEEALEVTDLEAGPVAFRHDNKLFLPAHSHFTKHQMRSFIDGITAKTLIITAVNGWPPGNMADHLSYLRVLEAKGILTDIQLPGSHHLHLDPKHAPVTAEAIYSHLEDDAHSKQTILDLILEKAP